MKNVEISARSKETLTQLMDEIYRMVSEGHYDKLKDLITGRMKYYNITVRLIRKKISIRKRAYLKLIHDLEIGEIDNSDLFNIQKIVGFLDISIDEMSQLYERITHFYQSSYCSASEVEAL